MNIINQVRIEKQKPKLTDVLKFFKKQGEMTPEKKEIIIQKLYQLYGKEDIKVDEEDSKFSNL